ncbi:MAG: hypothetical protein PHN42_04600 [Bacilli bacterium]|nr:hypothetical protein [Bacilli bacterium]
MTLLESLMIKEYVKILNKNNISNIEYYKTEFIKYIEDNNIEISDYLKEYLDYCEKEDQKTKALRK